jgi:hypothetical protein
MATYIQRRRQAGSGLLLMLLGAWGAIIPFVGPYFDYAYTPDKAWTYTSGRFWLSILPGAATVLGGLMLLTTGRAASFGAFLASLGGAWFIIGRPVITTFFHTIALSAGSPVTASGAAFGPATMHFLEALGFSYGLGAAILFFAARALGAARTTRVIAPAAAPPPGETARAYDDYPTQAYRSQW